MATSRSARSRRSRRCSRTTTPRRVEAQEPRAARDLHPAGGRACAGARAADAEVRGTADAGPGRDPAGPRRGRGGASAEDPAVAAAAPRQCRPRPPRRRDRAADRGPRLRSGDGADAAAAGAQAAAHASPSRWRITSRCRNMPGVRRRRVWTSMAARHLLPQRHRATTISISRPSCAARPTEFVTIRDDQKAPAESAGAFFFGRAEASAVCRQALILND